MKPCTTRWGVYFRAVRKRADLTQIEFSKLLGISQSCLSKIESGALTDPGVRVFRIAQRISRKARVAG